MKYLLPLIVLLAGCSGVPDKTQEQPQQEYDEGTKFGVSMIGKCLRQWDGEKYIIERYQPEGWVSICWVGPVCDYREPGKCVSNKVCATHTHGSYLKEQLNSSKAIYTVIDCKEK